MLKAIFYITLFLTSSHLYSSNVEEYKRIAIGKAFAELKKEATLLQEKKLDVYSRSTANIEELRKYTAYLVDLINKDIVGYSKEDVKDFLKKITLSSSIIVFIKQRLVIGKDDSVIDTAAKALYNKVISILDQLSSSFFYVINLEKEKPVLNKDKTSYQYFKIEKTVPNKVSEAARNTKKEKLASLISYYNETIRKNGSHPPFYYEKKLRPSDYRELSGSAIYNDTFHFEQGTSYEDYIKTRSEQDATCRQILEQELSSTKEPSSYPVIDFSKLSVMTIPSGTMFKSMSYNLFFKTEAERSFYLDYYNKEVFDSLLVNIWQDTETTREIFGDIEYTIAFVDAVEVVNIPDYINSESCIRNYFESHRKKFSYTSSAGFETQIFFTDKGFRILDPELSEDKDFLREKEHVVKIYKEKRELAVSKNLATTSLFVLSARLPVDLEKLIELRQTSSPKRRGANRNLFFFDTDCFTKLIIEEKDPKILKLATSKILLSDDLEFLENICPRGS
jgi:hypothetical protein